MIVYNKNVIVYNKMVIMKDKKEPIFFETKALELSHVGGPESLVLFSKIVRSKWLSGHIKSNFFFWHETFFGVCFEHLNLFPRVGKWQPLIKLKKFFV